MIINLVDDYMEENALNHKIKTGIFKSKFLRKNKPWLITHLPDIIGENHSCQQYLLEKYRELFDFHSAEELKRKAIEERLDQMIALPHNRTSRYRDDISERSDPPKTPPEEPEFESSSARVALYWIDKARFNLMLKTALDDPNLLSSICEECQSSQQLRLIPLRPFYDVLNEYKESFKGIPLKISHWKNYYSRNQEFKTLCLDCAYVHQLKQKRDIRIMNPYTKIAAEELVLLNKAQEVKDSKKIVKKLAVKWLMEARSRLGNVYRKQQTKLDSSLSFMSVSSNTYSLDISELEEP